MKITHLMLACFYIDNYSYQENLLPKYHKKMGYDVEIIASLESYDSNGNSIYLDAGSKYINEDGIPVTRLDYKRFPGANKLRYYIGLRQELDRIGPDIIFIHGVQFSDIRVVAKYCKLHKNVIVYADNHSDFSNSARNWVSKRIIHEIVWRRCAQIINPYVKKFYGVLPARVDFLVNEYKLPKDKVELLVMGADDSEVNAAEDIQVRREVRKRYSIQEDDFLIMFGGKIDAFKTQILLLMDAVNNIADSSVKLIVFGSVTQELKAEVENRCSDKVQYIGWKKPKESYPLFAASDLVVFPGRHSVFWEQVAGQGIPMLCKKWDGTTHVDLGGNVIFLTNDSQEEIEKYISELSKKGDLYIKMKNVAQTVAAKHFLYSEIAKRSIEVE